MHGRPACGGWLGPRAIVHGRAVLDWHLAASDAPSESRTALKPELPCRELSTEKEAPSGGGW